MALPQHTDDILKLATFQTGNGEQTVGIVRGDTVWSLQDVAKLPPGILPAQVSDMMGVIQHWDLLKNSLQLEGEGRKLSEVKIQAPIPRPTGTIMCIGKNYADHIKEVDTWKSAPGISTPEAPEHMIIFTKAPQSVIGPGAAIKYPHGWSELVDYEAELAVIIGKPGHGIRKEDALDHIFGGSWAKAVTHSVQWDPG
ncbi:hypothetical protein CY35_03G001400 [Sphagnum magellanicum]|nr:hypothetical protein CY35_03G001400 [Sphagnum magellanicum]